MHHRGITNPKVFKYFSNSYYYWCLPAPKHTELDESSGDRTGEAPLRGLGETVERK